MVQLPTFEDTWHFGAPPAPDEGERLRDEDLTDDDVRDFAGDFNTNAVRPNRPIDDLLDLDRPIVRRIAELHGGRAWAESQPGAGSSFYVAIPLTDDEPNERAG